MVRFCLVACSLSMLHGIASGGQRVLYIGESPCLLQIHEVDERTSSLVFRQAQTNIVMAEQDVLRKTIDGGTEKIRILEAREVNRPNTVAFPLKKARVYDRRGRLLDEAEIMKKARPGMQVVIARWGDKIGLDYLFVFKKETLILVLAKNQEVPRPETLPVWPLLGSVLEALARVEDQYVLRRVREIYESMK